MEETRKMRLAKYLARDEKNPDGKLDLKEVKAGLLIINDYCIEITGKLLNDLTSEEHDEFFIKAEKNTIFDEKK